MDKKEYIHWAGIDHSLDELCETLRGEFELSAKGVARVLRERATALDPRKKVKTVTIPKEFIEKYIEQEKSKGEE